MNKKHKSEDYLEKLILPVHQEDDHLVSGFSDIFAGFQVSGNLETGNLLTNLVILRKSPF